MYLNNGEYILTYPVKVFNLHNLGNERYSKLLEVFYTENENWNKLKALVGEYFEDILKVGREKVYIKSYYTRKINWTKLNSPRSVLRKLVRYIFLVDKHYLSGKNKRIAESVRDKDIAGYFMTKDFYDFWKEKHLPRKDQYGKPILLWVITMMVEHEFLIGDNETRD